MHGILTMTMTMFQQLLYRRKGGVDPQSLCLPFDIRILDSYATWAQQSGAYNRHTRSLDYSSDNPVMFFALLGLAFWDLLC